MKHYADDNKKPFTAKGSKQGGRRFAKDGGDGKQKPARHYAAEEPSEAALSPAKHMKAEDAPAAEPKPKAEPTPKAEPKPKEEPQAKTEKRGSFFRSPKITVPDGQEPPKHEKHEKTEKSERVKKSKKDNQVSAAKPAESADATAAEQHARKPSPSAKPKVRISRKEIVRKAAFEEPETEPRETVREPERQPEERAEKPEKREKREKHERSEKPDVDLASSAEPLSDDGTTDGGRVKENTNIRTDRPKRAHTECPATPTAPEPDTKAGYLPALVFAVFLALMALLFLFMPKFGFSANEKRKLATFPQVDAENVFSGEFGKEYETYLADHFPLRNLWVGVNAYTTLLEGNNGANGVYNSGDGYLINKPVSDYGRIPDNMGLLTEFKNQIGGIPMSAIMVPSTGYIVDDELPLIHNEYRDDEYFDYISAYADAVGIQFLDLRDIFKRSYKSGSQLYYKTDHHWTTEAAYIAYREYCKMFGLVTKPQEGFEVEEIKNFYGTTYAKSGFWLTAPDTLEIWKNPNIGEGDVHIKIYDGGDAPVKEKNTLFFYDHATEVDKYPVFIDGNHAKTVITNQNANKGTVLVIKDSFSHCFAPFLSESFSKVILVDMRYSTEDITKLVKQEKPDQVLVLYGIDNFAEDTDLGHLWG